MSRPKTKYGHKYRIDKAAIKQRQRHVDRLARIPAPPSRATPPTRGNGPGGADGR